MLRRALLLLTLAACGAAPADAPPSDDEAATVAAAHPGWLSGAKKHRAEALTSLFENGTIALQYDYVEALGDGRGYTAGRAGFTSATGDMLDVVRRYTKAAPGNALARYLPRLEVLAKNEDGSIAGLDGLPAAWAEASKDAQFRATQDKVVDATYFVPAMGHADAVGATLPLSRAVLYDTIIQHGDGTDPDGLGALLTATRAKVHGTPKTGVDEKAWLLAFLTVRRADLAHASDPSTRDVWAESVGRVDVLREIANAGNYGLEGPLHVDSKDWKAEVP
jgi:chitosanase